MVNTQTALTQTGVNGDSVGMGSDILLSILVSACSFMKRHCDGASDLVEVHTFSIVVVVDC